MTHSRSSLKNKELEKLNKRVKYWANLLGMSDWTFKIKKGARYFETDEETVGVVDTYEQFKRATVTINPNADIMIDFPEALDIAIIHELIHVLTASWSVAEKRLVELNFSDDQKEVANTILRQAMEASVVEVATAIYHLWGKMKLKTLDKKH